jgi:hypothetical protein
MYPKSHFGNPNLGKGLRSGKIAYPNQNLGFGSTLKANSSHIFHRQINNKKEDR